MNTALEPLFHGGAPGLRPGDLITPQPLSDGALYRVQPLGQLTPSPDPVPSWGCPTARVTAVLDAYVRLTPTQLRRAARLVTA